MTASIEPIPAADESSRFILPDDAPLVRNLAALWASDPALAEEVEALADSAAYPTEASRSGPPTVAVKTADGRSLYLHSRHHPAEEARRLIDTAAIDQKIVFHVLGLGLGHHVRELFERAAKEALIFVFEPDLRMLRTALHATDLSKLIESRRVTFFVNVDKAKLFQRLTPHTAVVSMGMETITHVPSLQLHGEFYRQVQTWIGEFAQFCRTNMNTLVLNSKRTAENISRNIGWYAAAPSLARLRDRYKGFPAVIISAGPSLRKNKHLLKGLSDKAVLVAVQTTLKPLLELGVEPQFVTSLDYHDICTRFFENLPKTLKTELIAEPKATTRVLGLNPGPLTLTGCDYAESLLREMGLNKPALTSGATVAHLAYYLSEFLGCDPIIFVGQDLGFSDGLCYAPGTSYEDVWRPELSRFCTVEMKQWEQIVRDRYILRKIPDVFGRPMYTEERLLTYLHQFERDFGKTQTRIIDATEGGALKRGTTPMPLAEAIERFCKRALPEATADHAGMRWDVLPRCIESLQHRRNEAREIERISRQTLPLLEEIRDHLDDQARVNRAIARIDELRAKMDQFGRTYDLVTQLTQQTELRRFEHDRKLAASKVDGTERQRRQVSRDIDNVRAMIDAAAEFQMLMGDVIEQLKTQSSLKPARAAAQEAA